MRGFGFGKGVAVQVGHIVRCKGHGTEIRADYLKLVGCLLLPCVLLIREDLGSTLVLLVIGFFILFVGGASRRWIIVTLLTLVVIVAGGLGLNSALNTWSGGDIQIYRRAEDEKEFALYDTVSSKKTSYKDEDVKKGVEYFYKLVNTKTVLDEKGSSFASNTVGVVAKG